MEVSCNRRPENPSIPDILGAGDSNSLGTNTLSVPIINATPAGNCDTSSHVHLHQLPFSLSAMRVVSQKKSGRTGGRLEAGAGGTCLRMDWSILSPFYSLIRESFLHGVWNDFSRRRFLAIGLGASRYSARQVESDGFCHIFLYSRVLWVAGGFKSSLCLPHTSMATSCYVIVRFLSFLFLIYVRINDVSQYQRRLGGWHSLIL